MALFLEKQATNGLTFQYHRICRIQTFVNGDIILEVESYNAESTRQLQKEYAAAESNEDRQQVYSENSFYVMDYVDGLTVKQAYEWLKTQDEFAGATDVLEDGQE